MELFFLDSCMLAFHTAALRLVYLVESLYAAPKDKGYHLGNTIYPFPAQNLSIVELFWNCILSVDHPNTLEFLVSFVLIVLIAG